MVSADRDINILDVYPVLLNLQMLHYDPSRKHNHNHIPNLVLLENSLLRLPEANLNNGIFEVELLNRIAIYAKVGLVSPTLLPLSV